MITNAWERNEVDPDGVRMRLLEDARDQSSRYVRVEREDVCVVAIGTIDGT